MKVVIEILNINTIEQLVRLGDPESVLADLINEHFENNKICSCGRELGTEREKENDCCIYCMYDEINMKDEIHETENTLRNI